jgi:hypothetical protein
MTLGSDGKAARQINPPSFTAFAFYYINENVYDMGLVCNYTQRQG